MNPETESDEVQTRPLRETRGIGRRKLTALIGIGLAIAISAVVIVALNRSGTSADTKEFGVAFSRSLESMARCDNLADPKASSNINCALLTEGTPSDYCFGVKTRSSAEWTEWDYKASAMAEKWADTDWKRFDSACDRWEEIGVMPVVLARPELIKLGREVRESVD